MTPSGLERLPEAWRADRLLLGDRGRWSVQDVASCDGALLVELGVDGRTSLLGRGDPVLVRRLVAARVHAAAPGWASLPRLGAGPAGVQGAPDDEGPAVEPEDDLPAQTRRRLGLEPVSAWDWLATAERPAAAPGEADVVRLDAAEDGDAIRDCLRQANPDTSADPGAPGEAAWFGVRDGDLLIGVIGAGARAGDPAGADLSWHLHGLGVRPHGRRGGLGRALTGAATRAGLASGADWVSLGMYASNAVARRVYERLGFQVEGRFTSYRAVAPAVGTPSVH
ncbi:GNAT family N-acetyltransferase [Actinotalea sp. M2MS4P-6]|uniref:GNAT family N-acetyltransferase n=1 Tax=Actinotalea sp. M2MS4P-6 TaxID=2983762 RepID=UPI0021E4E299|nr:GNAT family N-acetyltransferase [Actinotalea sp. M2MS4P-6]MCV2394560.1 GNAT family N-acetyltransferase [Actinotalea sp. M2MS4P-6]